MRPTRVHSHIIQYPFAHLMTGARLDSFCENGHDLILDVQGLQLTSSELFEQEEKIYERIVGKYIPLRLKFSNVSRLHRDDFFTFLENLAQDDPSRTIIHLLSWRQPKETDIYHRIGLYGAVGALMYFFAQQATCAKQDHSQTSMSLERDWSPAPPMPERLVPRPKDLHTQFGGDPITIKVNDKVLHHKLFIGGLDIQPKYRPQVDAILNLGEEASRWIKRRSLHPNDRTINKGEGSDGMTVTEIRQEAEWVIERLKHNQRVLVHCVAGMNRSTSICCAVLILLERLSAEAALERVREHHPWARPDSHHWLALRWLEINSKGITYGHKTRYDQSLCIPS
jgi:hypothetical protein